MLLQYLGLHDSRGAGCLEVRVSNALLRSSVVSIAAVAVRPWQSNNLSHRAWLPAGGSNFNASGSRPAEKAVGESPLHQNMQSCLLLYQRQP